MLRAALAFSLVVLLNGCADDDGFQEYASAPVSDSHDHDHGHGHGHEGAHGGHVFELDDAHGHHMELTFDQETRDITLYFYGAEIGTGVATTGVSLHLEGDTETELSAEAVPAEGETPESSSVFRIAGSSLPEGITGEEQLNGHIHATIAGEEFAADLVAHSHDDHDHGHEGHGHDDDHHDDHEHDDHDHDSHGDEDGHAEAAEGQGDSN